MFAFDCLFINGRSLLKEPLEVRYAVHAPCPPPPPPPQHPPYFNEDDRLRYLLF